MNGPAGSPRVIDVGEAARLPALPEAGGVALAEAGYLRPADDTASHFALGDVKAVLARLADEGTSDIFSDTVDDVDPQGLLDALDGRSEEMARRAFDIFQQGFPEAGSWSISEQRQF